MPIDKSILEQYVVTANSGKYGTWEEIGLNYSIGETKLADEDRENMLRLIYSLAISTINSEMQRLKSIVECNFVMPDWKIISETNSNNEIDNEISAEDNSNIIDK